MSETMVSQANGQRQVVQYARVSRVPLLLAKIGIEACIRYGTRLGRAAFVEAADFSGVDALRANAGTIEAELRRVLEEDDIPAFQELSEVQSKLTTGKDWRTFFLHCYGETIATNCSRCPETARLLEGVEGMHTAFFSILAPGKHIPPHRGPYKGVLRLHLALIVPSEDPAECGIRVADETRPWKVGETLIFDDSQIHEAWNHTNSVRVVLFVDIERKLPPPLSWINRWILRQIQRSSMVREVVDKLAARDAKAAAAE